MTTRFGKFGSAVLSLATVWLLGSSPTADAETAVGDWGHFLRYATKVFLLNPDGAAFTVTLGLFRWPVEQWNPREVNLRLTDPAGVAVMDGKVTIEGDSRQFDVPAGLKGVYVLEMNLPATGTIQGPDFLVQSSLDRSVVWTGDPNPTARWAPQGRPDVHAVMGRWLLLQCSVPRRWWFWVPPGTKSFTCRTQWIMNYQSQREDWGITIFTPRGQRIRRLWGDLDYDHGLPLDSGTARTMRVEVNVEPGAAGRFWCAELRFADSHNYSKVSFSLEGVPPYLARSPEEWFDPAAAAPPEVPLYDDDSFMQFARGEANAAGWPWLQNFSPCPSLGDPDGTQIRGNARFALWNPEDRPLALMVGTYLPRDISTNYAMADLAITGADGRMVLEQKIPIRHLHSGIGAPEPIPRTGAGVATVAISGVERWFAFTYPATPLVLLGDEVDGWTRFQVECGTARHWYFLVPKGTTAFSVRAAAGHESDVMHLEINAPDRTVALIYDRAGEREVRVPAGLDGKMWHLRTDIGSASTMRTPPGEPHRYLHHYLTLELRGVPGYLSPTREQWFDPRDPRPPGRR